MTSLKFWYDGAVDTTADADVAKELNADNTLVTEKLITVQDISFDKGLTLNNRIVETTGFYPPGVIIPYVGRTAPEGYLVCDGAMYDTRKQKYSQYKRLNRVLAQAFGGDQNILQVPDFREMFLRGCDNGTKRDPNSLTRTSHTTQGGNSGDAIGSRQDGDVKKHSHTVSPHSHTISYTKPVHELPSEYPSIEGGFDNFTLISARGYRTDPVDSIEATFSNGERFASTALTWSCTTKMTSSKVKLEEIGEESGSEPMSIGVNYLIKF